jgi:hypothetical protein
MVNFRGKRVNRPMGYVPVGDKMIPFPMPPTHRADGSVSYPEDSSEPEPIDYTVKEPEMPKKDEDK